MIQCSLVNQTLFLRRALIDWRPCGKIGSGDQLEYTAPARFRFYIDFAILWPFWVDTACCKIRSLQPCTIQNTSYGHSTNVGSTLKLPLIYDAQPLQAFSRKPISLAQSGPHCDINRSETKFEVAFIEDAFIR